MALTSAVRSSRPVLKECLRMSRRKMRRRFRSLGWTRCASAASWFGLAGCCKLQYLPQHLLLYNQFLRTLTEQSTDIRPATYNQRQSTERSKTSAGVETGSQHLRRGKRYFCCPMCPWHYHEYAYLRLLFLRLCRLACWWCTHILPATNSLSLQ